MISRPCKKCGKNTQINRYHEFCLACMQDRKVLCAYNDCPTHEGLYRTNTGEMCLTHLKRAHERGLDPHCDVEGCNSLAQYSGPENGHGFWCKVHWLHNTGDRHICSMNRCNERAEHRYEDKLWCREHILSEFRLVSK